VELLQRPAPVDLIEGVLAAKGAAMLYGVPGSCKTFLAVAASACLATRRPLFGQYAIPQAGNTIYIVGEGVSGFGQRPLAWKLAHQVDADQVVLQIFDGALNLMDPDAVAAFIDDARPLQPLLVTIDTLARCAIGADENAVKDVSKVIAAIDRIRFSLDCAALVIHHATKNGDAERGSSALRGAFDQMLSLDRADDLLTLRPDKAKDAAVAAPIGLRLVPVPGTASCVLTRCEDITGPVTASQLQALRVLRDLGDMGLQATVWERLSKLKEPTFYRVRGQLLKHGAVAESRHLYFITSTGKTLLAGAGEI
jgi:hypothetical protein